MKWISRRGFFDADIFYQKPKSYKYANKLMSFMNKFDNNESNKTEPQYSPDKNLYALANLLDDIQNILNHYESPYNSGKIGYSINLFSTLRDYHIIPDLTSFKSAHKTGSAADTVVGGLNVMEFASICYYLIDENVIKHPYNEERQEPFTIGIGMYGAAANDIDIKMSNRYAGARGFVHIDLNPKVALSDYTNINYHSILYNSSFSTTWNRLWFGKDGKDKFDPGRSVRQWWSEDYDIYMNTIKPKLLEAIQKSKG